MESFHLNKKSFYLKICPSRSFFILNCMQSLIIIQKRHKLNFFPNVDPGFPKRLMQSRMENRKWVKTLVGVKRTCILSWVQYLITVTTYENIWFLFNHLPVLRKNEFQFQMESDMTTLLTDASLFFPDLLVEMMFHPLHHNSYMEK